MTVIKSFVNSEGRVFPVRGISPYLPDLLRAAVKREWEQEGRALPETPTYVITLADGSTQRAEHSADTLETDEERAIWAAYKAARDEFENAVNMRTLNACILAIDTTPLADEEWRQEMEVIGVDLPERSVDLRLLYGQTVVIRGAEDAARVMTAVLSISGLINEEQAAAAEAAFRSHMEGAEAQ